MPTAADDVQALIAGARRVATLLLLVGLAVAAIVVMLVAVGAQFLFDGGPGPRPTGLIIVVPAFVVIPMIGGVAILVRMAIRLYALRVLERHPERLVATELAQRLGRPALRFCFAGGRGVTIITGERDPEVLSQAARARALPVATVRRRG